MIIGIIFFMIISFILGKEYGEAKTSFFYRCFVKDIYRRVGKESRRDFEKAVKDIEAELIRDI